LSDGGGRASVTSIKPQKSIIALTKLKERLHTLGWRRRFIEAHVDEAVGAVLDEQREETVLDELTKAWLYEAYDDTYVNIVDILYAAGLSKQMARKANEAIAPLSDTCYSRTQLLEIAVEYALNVYATVLKPNQHYLIDTPSTDVWYPNATFKYVYNTNGPVDATYVLTRYPQLQSSADFFFHATNVRSALNIVEDGIAHLEGRKCLDFGITPSFYLTPDLSAAIEWCDKKQQMWKGERCIIVFLVPRDSIKALKSKIFHNETTEWGDLVTSSRRCNKKYNALDKFELVNGPMAANVHDVMHENKRARPHNPPKFQLASKSINSDIYLRSCLAGAIFMKHV